MSNIKLVRRNGQAQLQSGGGTSPPVSRVLLPTPRLGSQWWSAGWETAFDPLDDACRLLCGAWRAAWGAGDDHRDDPDGVVFAETRLGEDVPAELTAAVLRIPDGFAGVGTLVQLRRVDQGGNSILRVCLPTGEVLSSFDDPEQDVLRDDRWAEVAAYWVLALGGVRTPDIERLLRRELP